MTIRRRSFVAGGLAATFLSSSAKASLNTTHKAPAIEVISKRVISHDAGNYHGWPTLAQGRDGELLLSYSGGRESHVCPFGRVELMRSKDNGKSWSYPQTIIDTPIDDRDSGVLTTDKGTLLITTFTSNAYESIMNKALKDASWADPRLARWVGAHGRVPAKSRKELLGNWIIRSTNNGISWGTLQRCPLNSPHGPVQLSKGRLMYAGKRLWSDEPVIGVSFSDNDGRSWSKITQIPTRKGDDPAKYHELHAIEASNGRLIAHIRNHNPKNAGETLQSESTDGGKTWSEPHSIGVWGLPSHLLRLRNGNLLMSYGYRRKPYGNQVRLSQDHGVTWSQPLTLSDDGAGYDLGYTTTVELNDGTMLSVWYELMPNTKFAQLRQAHWKWS